ncbi:uncharacterized protein METZ01_LOCUS21306 [marine metagenome]|uniref:Uncharacterized protein n=1 Tax=marine metagenome TaxID=408172 RepID=A0A381PN63_9ZZZZ
MWVIADRCSGDSCRGMEDRTGEET